MFNDILCFSLSRTHRQYQPIDEPGPLVNGENSYQKTSSYWAVRSGETEIVSRLLETEIGITTHLINYRWMLQCSFENIHLTPKLCFFSYELDTESVGEEHHGIVCDIRDSVRPEQWIQSQQSLNLIHALMNWPHAYTVNLTSTV